MSPSSVEQAFPRGPLLAIGALVAATLLAVTVVRLTGWGRSTVALAVAPPVAERLLRFVDRSDGGVDVLNATSGVRVQLLAPGHDGFIRATLRSLARERQQHGLGADAPFRLAVTVDGHLTLDDLATGRHIDLGAFGHTNSAVFARLLGPPTAR